MEPCRRESHWACDSGRTEAAAIRPLMAVGFAARTPQRGDARRRPRNVAMAEGGFKRRDPAITEVARWRVTFSGLVEITSKNDSAELQCTGRG